MSPVVPPPVVLRRHVPLPLLLLVLLALPLPGTAQAPGTETARRALQLEDFYRIRSVESPEISPDGRWVIFTVSLPVEEDNGTVRQVWVVEADGAAAPVRLLHGGEDVSRPRWEDSGRLRYTLRDTTWIRDPGDPSAPPAPVASAEGLSGFPCKRP